MGDSLGQLVDSNACQVCVTAFRPGYCGMAGYAATKTVGKWAGLRSQPQAAPMVPCRPVTQAFNAVSALERFDRLAAAAGPRGGTWVAWAASQAASEAPVAADRAKGRMTYKPASFGEMVSDAVRSVRDGLAKGLTRMEVRCVAETCCVVICGRTGPGPDVVSDQIVRLPCLLF
jgi:hypothetical protein